MTDFDKRLVEIARTVSQWSLYKIDFLIEIADSSEAKDILRGIRWDLYDAAQASL